MKHCLKNLTLDLVATQSQIIEDLKKEPRTVPRYLMRKERICNPYFFTVNAEAGCGRKKPNLNQKIRRWFFRNVKHIPCCYCGRFLTKESATVEHIIPLFKGGSYAASNLTIACSKCNGTRGDNSFSKWKQVKRNEKIIYPDPILFLDDSR
jgi:5-methylcytosine-specific restriction endonuclease McrA